MHSLIVLQKKSSFAETIKSKEIFTFETLLFFGFQMFASCSFQYLWKFISIGNFSDLCRFLLQPQWQMTVGNKYVLHTNDKSTN